MSIVINKPFLFASFARLWIENEGDRCHLGGQGDSDYHYKRNALLFMGMSLDMEATLSFLNVSRSEI